MSKEQRQHPRFQLQASLEIFDTLSGDKMGILANISEQGLMVLGDKTLVDGAVYQVAVTMNDGITLELGVECLWSSSGDTDSKSWSGFHIIDISEHAQSVLDTLIADLSRS